MGGGLWDEGYGMRVMGGGLWEGVLEEGCRGRHGGGGV